jgi:NAD(P)-dependent dehydrogenase (short-subunit alcohol dehydrogenase family)
LSGRLDGSVAIVTGASSGLGAAYARALAEAGARLVLSGRRAELLEALAVELPSAVAVPGDVGAPGTAERLAAAAIDTYGRVDVLVNNAGGLRDRTLAKMSFEEFDEVLRSHVYGAFLVTRACVGHMREQGGGTIINVGSDSGLRGAFGQTNYAAAKGALAAMTLTWARELGRYGITCNCLLPNALTAMTEGLDKLLAEYGYGPPGEFPRAMGEAAEVAPLVVLLASGRFRHVNGLLLGLGGDKLSIWEPAREVGWAFRDGGWSEADLEASLELVLRGDPNGGATAWSAQPAVPPRATTERTK